MRAWRASPARPKRPCATGAAAWASCPVYKRVDTCAAEFATSTAYLYSTYEEECEAEPTDRKKIMILGGGPNRIGQGIEFDYCCVHASLVLREDGYETIMVNCNPETVSTDYDTSDRLYFEPLTLEDVLEIIAKEKPVGVIVQYGGQTPLKLCRALEAAGAPIIGTSPDSIDIAEDRERFSDLVRRLSLRQPANATARTEEQALRMAREVGYPLVVRPSYVLGGRAMEVVYAEEDLKTYMTDRGAACPTTARCCSTASSTWPSKWTSTPSATAPMCSSAASWNTWSRPACTPVIPAARCRRTACRSRSSSSCASRPASWRWA